jgi:hypothetical protein
MKTIANIIAPDKPWFYDKLSVETKPVIRRDRHADAVRNLLLVNSVETDWYVKGPLLALYSFPELLSLLPKEIVTGMLPHALELEKPQFTNCSFIQVNDKIKLTWKPTTLPKTIKTVLDFNSGSVKMSRLGETYTLPTTSREGHIVTVKDLHKAFPGCSFAINLVAEQPEYNFTLPPSSYPYKAVASMLSKSSSATMLLNRNAKLDSFFASPDDFYKVGLMAAVIVMDAIK